MPRKGQDRTRLTGRLTLLFISLNLCCRRAPTLRRIYAPSAFTIAFFGLSAQTFPWYPMVSHKTPMRSGGRAGLKRDGRASRRGRGAPSAAETPGLWKWRKAGARGAMTQFLGTHIGKLDRKGRISVPAPFRAALERGGAEDLVLRPSHRAPCIEAWPIAAFEALASGMDRLDAFSDQADDLAAALFADAHAARADNEGRLVLPEALIAHAALSDAIACVGVGRIFQIWEPEAARLRTEEARLRARERGLTLPAAGGKP